jgi:hypothetical protein
MTTADQIKSLSTQDLLTVLDQGVVEDVILRGIAETTARSPERRPELLRLLLAPATSLGVRRRIARYLSDADLDLGEVQLLANMLFRQTLEPDPDLVRHLVKCVSPHARKHIERSTCVAVMERLLDVPGLDRHARAEVLKSLAEAAEVHDIERLLSRSFQSEEEQALVGRVAGSVLTRPLFIRRLSSSAFEDLVCRALEARERSRGTSARFRVCGGPYDGGVDGRGGSLYATGADDPGETSVEVQCKNTDRFSMRDVDEFDTRTSQASVGASLSPPLRDALRASRIFVTAANPPRADALIKDLLARGIELITGPLLVALVKQFLGREATLSRF